MKLKRFLSLVISVLLCMLSFAALAEEQTGGGLLIMPSPQNKVSVMYEDEPMVFDVPPIIENSRTLVPFRAIFEKMGCSVGYNVDENGRQIVSARRADDNLMLTIGENAMYFNGNRIELDVPAKIKDDRTLVPVRAITEAFECKVLWEDSTKTVSIYQPAGEYKIKAQKLSETVKDADGSTLIEAVAYYPAIENPDQNDFIKEVNDEYKWLAEKFISDAKASKEDALYLKEAMGKEEFRPFVFESTFEENHNSGGILSLTSHKYINVGGMHPSTSMESMTYSIENETELSVSAVLDESKIEEGLIDHITDLFAQKLTEIGKETGIEFPREFIYENIGYVQFYLEDSALVIYFNQGEVFPYALGVVSIEIPYDPQSFLVDISTSLDN